MHHAIFLMDSLWIALQFKCKGFGIIPEQIFLEDPFDLFKDLRGIKL
jgi:hypothetical protein